jgi:hypothetical protein
MSEATNTWPREATLALVEASTMSDSIGHIVEELLDDGPEARTFAMLEAITACLLRMDRLVQPAIEAAPQAADPEPQDDELRTFVRQAVHAELQRRAGARRALPAGWRVIACRA